MARPSNREKILEEGLKLIGERGLGAASVRDIASAAGVPLGSFTNHFASKEAFGREVVERYFANRKVVVRDTLRNDSKSPRERLKEYIALSKTKEACGGNHGSLLGTLAAEADGFGDEMRHQLSGIFTELTDAVAYCLKAAVRAGEVDPNLDCKTVAGFIVSSHQGAVMLAKTEKSPAAIARFEKVLFSSILSPVN